MIHFDNVSKRYPGGHTGLAGVSFRIEAGEMVFLTGHSGAGKSTLLKLIGLLERSSEPGARQRPQPHPPEEQPDSLPPARGGIDLQDHRLL
ncbi:ATP-binding cassette domain-containing protein [endosymbiont of Lamellibrachia barhami]|uniref:ATP-binding cassette domain-containing protein n=1 Tax=endosymbiont of Lamellibrachia barhami TaxID=205975 RepID=UPI001FE534E1|nr:ATP-binding cassette domain-containing protein [endosymbiont of Lamellibrachia barhami]